MTTEREISPTWLAAGIGAGLVVLMLVLSALAPPELPVDMARLQVLVAEGQVDSILVSESGIVARLHGLVSIDVEGQRYRTAAVVVAGVAADMAGASLARWGAAGVPVAHIDPPAAGRWREAAWAVFVAGLLAFGVVHLVSQARRHRREGSPRQHLEAARADLDAGRITPDEYERRASALSIEL